MKFVRALLCVLLLVGLVVGVTAQTGGDQPAAALVSSADKNSGKDRFRPKQGGFFNVPRAGAKQFNIQSRIVDAIEHARKDSTIRISLFSWDRKYPAEAVIRARKRGVRVQILLNDHQVTPAQRMLHRRLGTNRSKRNFAYECKNGCRSKGENLHTKFFLFTHTGAAKNVVMAGSTNFTMNSAANQYNDIWIKNGAPKLHRKFVNLFKEMRQDKRQKPAYWVQRAGKNYELQATPFPHFRANNDPIMKKLNRVRCHGAKGGTGNKYGRTIVRVVMHAWNEERGIYLAKKIRELYANGCDVRVMYGYGGEAVRNTFAGRTKRGYVPVHTTGYDTNEDGFIDLYTHQKELLINGRYGKDSSTRLVITGSSNWNNEGLRGDEAIISIRNGSTYRDYVRNFNFIWEHRSHLVQYIPYKSGAAWGSEADEEQPKRFGPAWETG